MLDKSILSLKPAQKVVVSQEAADELGISRSTTVGEVREALGVDEAPQQDVVEIEETQDNMVELDSDLYTEL